MTNQTETGADLAQHIADAMKDHPGPVQVRINPNVQTPAIPEHVAKNILEFLRRVESKGMEAVAWVEAYNHVQQHLPQPTPQGVPFPGLPTNK
jgi:hypothetical protein